MDVDRLPERRLAKLLDAIKAVGFAGANITYPFKQTGAPLSVVVRAEPVPGPTRIFVAINGQPEAPVRIDRYPRYYGGDQVCLQCPTCERSRRALYVIHGRLSCRVCAKLMYRYKRAPLCPASALRRATKLRRRLGGVLFGPPPPRPEWVRRDYYARWLVELSTWEAQALAALATTKGGDLCHDPKDRSSLS